MHTAIYVNTHDDQEDIADTFKNMTLAIPLVDNENRLVGIITIDDIVDVIEENTEDFYKMAAVAPSDEEYTKYRCFGAVAQKDNMAFGAYDIRHFWIHHKKL